MSPTIYPQLRAMLNRPDIQEKIQKQGPVELFWDQNDTLSTKDIDTLIEKDLQGKYTLEQQLIEDNEEQLHQTREEYLKELIESLKETPLEITRKNGCPKLSDYEKPEENELIQPDWWLLADEKFIKPVNSTWIGKTAAKNGIDLQTLRKPNEEARHNWLQTIVEEEMQLSANLKQLARNSGRSYFTVRCGEPIQLQAFQGITNYEDIAEFCEILNLSPHHFQTMVKTDSPLLLPEITTRNGHELVKPADFFTVLNETNYGGELVFLCSQKISDLLENVENYVKGPIRINAGTMLTIHDYLNGASATEVPLSQDLDLPAGSYTLYHDNGDRFGVQACCEMTDKVWKAGNILPIDIEFPPKYEVSDTQPRLGPANA